MREFLSFFVPGIPRQRGSKNPIPFQRKDGSLGVSTPDAAAGSKEWMARVSEFASKEYKHSRLLEHAIRLNLCFRFTRPKSHYGTGKNADVVKPSAPRDYTKSPDLSKLVRAVEDALTGVVWKDDRQVIGYTEVDKIYADFEPAGVAISVFPQIRADIKTLQEGMRAAKDPEYKPEEDLPF